MDAPSFNNWTSLFLIAAIQGLFICAVFSWKLRQTQSPFRWLIKLAVLFSLTLVVYVLFWTGYSRYFPYLIGVVEHFPWLFGPIFYFYFRQVFTQQRFQRRDWVHLFPFLLLFLWRLPLLFIPPSTITSEEPPSFLVLYWKLLPFFPWARIMHMIGYAAFIHKKFFALSRTIPRVKRWYASLNLFFAGFITSYTSYFLLVRLPFFNSQWDYMISFSMTIFIYGLALVGYLQPQVFGIAYRSIDSSDSKYKNSGLTASAAQQLQEKLCHLMEQEKLYRDSELRLEKLASILGTTRHNLSQVINERMEKSFFDYINSLRIEESKALLISTSKEKMTIIEIAYQVGFNNKVSFNSTFKKLIGLTPSQYREQQSQSIAVKKTMNPISTIQQARTAER